MRRSPPSPPPTPEWIARWEPIAVPAEPPAPVFLVGFPRSGTTLLDTLLMNLPQLQVMEEQPVLRAVEAAIAAGADIGRMTAGEARMLRDHYFATAAGIGHAPAGRRWSTSIRCTWRACRWSSGSFPTPR